MVSDPFTSRTDPAVVLDLSGFAFTALPGLKGVPPLVEERVTQTRALLRAGEGVAALARINLLRSEPMLWSQPELRAVVRGLEGSAKLTVGASDAGEADLLHSLADAKTARRITSPLGVSLLNNLAVISFQFQHRASAAESQLRQAIDLVPDRAVDRLNQRPICFRNLGVVQEANGASAAAARSLRQALDETTRGPDEVLETLDLLVGNREKAGDLLAVEALRVSAFSMMERTRDKFPQAFVRAARDLGLLLLKSGELGRLGPIVREQIDVMHEYLPPAEQWRLTPALLLLALHHADSGEWGKSYALIEWALDVEKLTPPDIAGPIDFLRNVTAYFRKEALHGQANTAREVYRVAVAKRSKR